MRAGHRSIFDNRDRRSARAFRDVWQGLAGHQLIKRHPRALRQDQGRETAEHSEKSGDCQNGGCRHREHTATTPQDGLANSGER